MESSYWKLPKLTKIGLLLLYIQFCHSRDFITTDDKVQRGCFEIKFNNTQLYSLTNPYQFTGQVKK